MKSIIISVLKFILKVYPEKYREYYQILVVYYVNKLSPSKKKEFYAEIERRSHLSLFNVDELSAELSSYSEEYYYVNSRFAIAHALRKYANWNKPINAVIEHGVYYDDDLKDMEVYNNRFPGLMTFGPVRYNFLNKLIGHEKEIVKLGPHIAYVDSLLSDDELKTLKKELGSVFLAIPTHSIESHKLEFDYEGLIADIKEKGANYDTILVNVYYMDVIFGRHQVYLDAGFKVVTSGHRSDLNFLPRLKSIISLADMTMTNRFSTPIGYCLHLNKPHYIYNQELTWKPTEKALDFHADTKVDKMEDKLAKYNKVFSNFSTKITPDQMEVYNNIWGGNESVKSKEELYSIFEKFSKKSIWK